MKKVILPAAAIVLIYLAACNNTTAPDKQVDSAKNTKAIMQQKQGKNATEKEAKLGTFEGVVIPTFKDDSVNAFIKNYLAFLNAYRTEMKDPAILQQLSNKMEGYLAENQRMVLRLKNDAAETKKLNDFMTSVLIKAQAIVVGK